MTTPANTVPQTGLSVRLTPRASANAVVRYADGVLFLRLAAPPVEGAANAAWASYVADLLGLRPSQVTVSHGHKSRDKHGHKSRDKVLAITGLSEETVRERLTGRWPS